MKHITEHLGKKAQAQEPREYGKQETEIVKRLFESMRANYGSAFLASLDDEKTQLIWERSWLASIAGKRQEIVAKALTHCLNTQPRPFARADFQEAYRALLGNASQRVKKDLRLPKETWMDRKQKGIESLKKIKAILGNADQTRE